MVKCMKGDNDKTLLRKAENTSFARMHGFNKKSITEFNKNSKSVIYRIDLSRITNF